MAFEWASACIVSQNGHKTSVRAAGDQPGRQKNRPGKEAVERRDPRKSDKDERVNQPHTAVNLRHSCQECDCETSKDRDLNPPQHGRLAVETVSVTEDSRQYSIPKKYSKRRKCPSTNILSPMNRL
jgi:hypothetical protein